VLFFAAKRRHIEPQRVPEVATSQVPEKVPRDPRQQRAAALRQEAAQAYEAHDWSTCLDKLDEATQVDPAGDEPQDAQALRVKAYRAAAQERRTVHEK
jgi:hypothetical protein